jgi:hypothetical protein
MEPSDSPSEFLKIHFPIIGFRLTEHKGRVHAEVSERTAANGTHGQRGSTSMGNQNARSSPDVSVQLEMEKAFSLTGVWVPHDTRDRSWISSGAGRRRPRSAPGVSLFARHHCQQVLRLAGTLRKGERTQRLGSPRFLGGVVGKHIGELQSLPVAKVCGEATHSRQSVIHSWLNA